MKVPSFFAALLLAAMPLQAEVKPNPLFADHAVLQQGLDVPVWGTSRDGENVTVEINGQRGQTTAKDGKWLVRLKALKAGGPFKMTIRGDNVVTINDVLVGEVWLCGGQSNMERQLGLRGGQQPIENWQQEVAAANYPQIRQFLVGGANSDVPLTDVRGTWTVCSPATAAQFTAVGYFFGRDLFQKLKVPIGLVHSSVGGTPAQAWMSLPVLKAIPQADMLFVAQEKAVADYPALLAKFQTDQPQILAAWQVAADAAAKAGKPAPGKPGPPRDPSKSTGRPAGLYNAMIAPLIPYAMRGVIWYQGEANCGNPALYRTLLPDLITSWRAAWGEGNFPFLFVQLAPFRANNPELRDAQLQTWLKVPGTAMVVTTDVGDANDIHPTRKGPVGARLALAARALAYGEKLEFSGPLFSALHIEGGRAVLSFTHVGGGLVAKDGPLRGFEIAGADGKFQPATAEIRGETVAVSSPQVPAPVAVRFGWANVPDGNLFNQAGLPASPFRTSGS